MMVRRISKAWFALCLIIVVTGGADAFAQNFTRERLFDNSIIPPGRNDPISARNFVRFGDDLVFIGSGFDTTNNRSFAGVYRFNAGSITTIVDTDDLAENGQAFNFFDGLSVQGSDLVITGRESDFRDRLYRFNDSQGLRSIANSLTTNIVSAAGLDSDSVHLFGQSSTGGVSPLIRIDGGVRSTVVSSATIMPDHDQPFASDTFRSITLRTTFTDSGEAVIIGFDQSDRSGRNGVYMTQAGDLVTVIDNTQTPTSIGQSLQDFIGPATFAERIGFGSVYEESGNSVFGLFETIGTGDIRTIVDTNTLIPGTNEAFGNELDLASLALGENTAIFLKTNQGSLLGSQLFFETGGLIGNLVTSGDMLDGETIQTMASPVSLGGNDFIIPIRFENGQQTYYAYSITAIPEPTSWAVLMIGAAVTGLRCRRRRR